MENELFTERTFTSYGDALDWYLESEYGHGINKKIAKKLLERYPNEKKLSSWKGQIGQWRNKTRTPDPHNIDKVNSVLNVRIVEKDLNEWIIKRTDNKNKPQDEQSAAREEEVRYQLQKLADLITQDKVQKPAGDDPFLALELASLLIRNAIEILRKESSD